MARMIALWTFACKLYSQPGMKNACLVLQDHYEVNVPLLLTACWVSHLQFELCHDTAERLQHDTEQWEKGCIAPLRQLRREMKVVNAATTMASWNHIREEIKTVELAAEQALLETLEKTVLAQHSFVHTEHVSSSDVIPRLMTNVYRCIPHLARLPSASSSPYIEPQNTESQSAEAQSTESEYTESRNKSVESLLSSIIHAANPQMQYDDILIQVNQYPV